MIHSNPEGYKKLLVYKKSDELHWQVLELAERIEKAEREKREIKGSVDKILLEVAHQLGRAARSPMSNIVEGWKRNTTREYFDFLGFSIASTEEIKKDCEDIIRGKYKKLMGEKGITGDKGATEIEIAKLPFYPLPPFLPFAIEIYLRCKELDFLLHQLQQSLEQKMKAEGSMTLKQKIKNRRDEEKEADEWLAGEMKRLGLNQEK